jgi:hypothetical protein
LQIVAQGADAEKPIAASARNIIVVGKVGGQKVELVGCEVCNATRGTGNFPGVIGKFIEINHSAGGIARIQTRNIDCKFTAAGGRNIQSAAGYVVLIPACRVTCGTSGIIDLPEIRTTAAISGATGAGEHAGAVAGAESAAAVNADRPSRAAPLQDAAAIDGGK